MKVYDVIKRPLITEKAMLLKESNQYVFEVCSRAEKEDIRNSLEALYGVKVSKVRTSIVPGKYKRFGKGYGKTKSWKKAIVTLSEGQIEVFDGV